MSKIRRKMYRSRLNDTLRKAYDACAEALLLYKPVIPLVDPALRRIDALGWEKVLYTVFLDNPDYIKPKAYGANWQGDRGELCLEYDYSLKKLETYCRRTAEKVASIVREYHLDSGTQLERAWKVFRYLCTHVVYDHSFARLSYTAAGALLHNKAVCLGIAAAFVLLAEAVGLTVFIAIGKASFDSSDYHAWNVLDLGAGMRGHIDVVGALDSPDFNQGRSFFMLSTETIAAEYVIITAPYCCGSADPGVYQFPSSELNVALRRAKPGEYFRVKLSYERDHDAFVQTINRNNDCQWVCHSRPQLCRLYLEP